MFFEPGNHKNHGFTFDPFKATVSPRPIGWISTLDENGVITLHLQLLMLFPAPPCVIFQWLAADGSLKDSAQNAEKTGEFVCNIVGEAQAKQMNQTAIHFPHGTSEMEHAGLEDCRPNMSNRSGKERRYIWNAHSLRLSSYLLSVILRAMQ